ncbi:MAG: hypothetical protein IJZ50_04660 [Alistipes sp.]|nr:hypothetical protein [Alistipes sp.]
MKLLNYVVAGLAMLCAVACGEPMEDNTVYPVLDTLDDTMWWSYDQRTNTYYDIWFDGEGRGRMLGYDTQERENETVNRPFSYTFTPATEQLDGIVRINFDDGVYFGGFLVPKGQFHINNIAVYFIQLYEVDAEGNVLYDMEGKIKDSLQMWKE